MLLIIFLGGTYGFYVFKHYQKTKELRFVEALKLEEQETVRRQTAEDFHDDLGNKLTRINMLSELLDKKIAAENRDEKELIAQIKTSALELYEGTKNILWALNPDNDNLQDVYEFIEKFAAELYANTNIHFEVRKNYAAFKDIRFPLGFGRNIVLVCKELLHNILKHSHAQLVTFSIGITSYNSIEIEITDNGCGFDVNAVTSGNGIRNIKKRINKINGDLKINSEFNKGTVNQLTFPLPNALT